MLDRQVQKTESFTGIDGSTRRPAIQESMGRVVDRSREHSARPTSRHPGARLLLEAVKAWRRQDAARRRRHVLRARAAEGVAGRGRDWREVLTPEMSATRIEQTV